MVQWKKKINVDIVGRKIISYNINKIEILFMKLNNVLCKRAPDIMQQ